MSRQTARGVTLFHRAHPIVNVQAAVMLVMGLLLVSYSGLKKSGESIATVVASEQDEDPQATTNTANTATSPSRADVEDGSSGQCDRNTGCLANGSNSGIDRADSSTNFWSECSRSNGSFERYQTRGAA